MILFLLTRYKLILIFVGGASAYGCIHIVHK